MLRNKVFFAFGMAFLGLLLVLPVVHYAVARDDGRVPVSPALEKQIANAGPDDIISAVVRVKSVGPPVSPGRRDEVFAKLRQNSTMSQRGLMNFLRGPAVAAGVAKTRQFWLDNLVLVKARKNVIEQIARRPDVVEVFDNFTVRMDARPAAGDGGVVLSHQVPQWDPLTHIGVKQVWSSYGFTGTGIRVGGLDTGVDIAHPDIAGKMINNSPGDPTYPGGWAEFDGDGNLIPGSVPHDSDQHGTHTTGTMIGGSASGYDIGVAPGASLMHGLVIPGGSGSFTQVVGGMEWIIDPDDDPMTDDGAQVVNMSLGATGTHAAMVVPTDNMEAAGVFPSFSIGNSGPSPNTTGSPGNVPSAYGVGATNSSDVIASFSSRGPVTWNEPPYVGTYIKPDISAPGVQIFSSVPGGEWEWTGGGLDWSGTSMAAPHVSGTVALMLQANPSLTVATAKQLLAQTALDLGDPGMDNNYGWGRVNTYAAVSAALAGVGTLEGTIYSSGGGTVEGAEILITDTGQRVFSDATGYYSIQLVAGTHTVQVSRFGYDPQTVPGVEIIADATTVQDFTLNQLPSGTIAGTVSDEETFAGIAASIDVKLGGMTVVTSSTDPFSGAYSVVLPIGTYDLVFTPVFPYPVTARYGIGVYESMTTTVDVALGGAQVLIVDDDGGDAYETYYEQAALAAGRSYLTVDNPPTAADMSAFETVIWLTGDDYTTTLTSTDQAELATYLDGGGRLFISGQDIGYDIHTAAFYADYLHASYVQDDVKLGGVLGNGLSPVGTGLAFDIKGGDGANNQAYPSEMDPIAPAMTAFFYDASVPEAAATSNDAVKDQLIVSNGITSSGTAGLTYEDANYRLVYFSFGFEAIADATNRTMVMDRVLDWLLGFPKIAHTPLGDTEDTANPYPVKAIITSDNFPLDPSTFAVVYSTGGPDMTVPMAPTGNPDEYVGSIPPQATETEVAYYITAADVEAHVTTHPLGAPALRHDFTVAKDEMPPDMVHQPLRNTNDLAGPYNVSAIVTDNIGVEAVYLLYSKNGGLYHRVKMMHTTDNEYVGAIPGPTVVGDVFHYHLYAMDESYSGNMTRLPASGYYEFEIVEEFAWDFELDDGGFMESGGVWQWGAPTSGPGAAHSGMNVWATVLAGNYPSNANATLDVPEISLGADKPYVVFSFWHWYNMENRYDGGNVKVSVDGGMTWDIVTPAGGYDEVARSGNSGIPGEPCFTNAHPMWQEEVFDLSPYAGQNAIIRFHMGSDGSVTRPGWYVDDARLRKSDVDDVAPSIVITDLPVSTFDTAGPYAVTANVTDLFSGLASATMYYSTDDGASYTSVPMTAGSGDEWSADIPGQPEGTRLKFYLHASDNTGNETTNPPAAPADAHAFSILPSADILVIVGSSGGISIDEFRDALETNGHQADYWYQPTQGNLTAAQLQLYKMVVLDERGSLTSSEQSNLAAFLNSGSLAVKKRFFILGRDLSFFSSTRPWMTQYMHSDYVKDDPAYRELTGEPGDPIGIGETFVISGSYPDEVQRSTSNPGGQIVYRFTGPGGASLTRYEVKETHEKDGKEWDGVMPHDPGSLDAAAGIRYAGDAYRSVYFTFNLDYIPEPARRAAIVDRVIHWTAAPDIVHTPLLDTENTTSPYDVVAQVYSENLDPTRVLMTYDVGAGDVVVTMTATGNPDEYAASIPAQPFGTSVNYYLSAANLDGTTSHHPEGAPTDRHTFQVISDAEPPVIVHTPPGVSSDLAGPYTIQATITDNVGVDASTVQLTYNKNGGPNTTVSMASLGGDDYAADIPGPSIVGDVYNYFMTARDIATIPNTGRDPATGTHTLEIADYFAWDFETDDGGLAAGGPDWEWGTPSSGPGGAYSGVNAWATKLGGNYSSSSNSTLDLPELVVPSGKAYAELSFWQWYYIEPYYDGGNVKISTDGGGSWTILTPDIGYPEDAASSGNAGIPGEACFSGYDHDAWEQVKFDLTPYKGMSVVIRLHFGSDSSVQRVGWYVDDVRVEGIDDTEAPVIATTVPAGTFDTAGPYTVTSVITDGLSGVASATLHYSTNDGSSYTAVAMTPTGGADEYSGDIPGQSAGTRIKLYVEASDNAANTSTDPSGAPGVTYEFGIMPSGDYLVLLGGASHTSPTVFQQAFSAIGRTADIWDWDDLGMPTVAILEAYDAVIVDESFYFDTTQRDSLGAWLSTPNASLNRVLMMGRDLSYGSSARPWMEQYTGTAYVKDDPSWRQVSSTPGNTIGNDETFTISGSYPDELKLSTTYPGATPVYKWSGVGSAHLVIDSEQDLKDFYDKSGKPWDPRLWPNAPSGPDSIAGASYVGTTYAAVYFSFNFSYIQEDTRRAGILERSLDWLTAATSMSAALVSDPAISDLPDRLELGFNYPNPFNPVTNIKVSIPPDYAGDMQLRVYNVKGQLVKTVFSGRKEPGYHTFTWDGTNNYGTPVSSGVYFARFVAADTRMTRKMVLLK